MLVATHQGCFDEGSIARTTDDAAVGYINTLRGRVVPQEDPNNIPI